MKKIFALILSFMFIFLTASVSVSAETAEEDNIVVTCGDTDFIFEAGVSAEVQERVIAEYFSEGEDDAHAYGLTCTLFGHKLETSTLITVTHNAKTTEPKCLKKYYDQNTCTRCDYATLTLKSQLYISCC